MNLCSHEAQYRYNDDISFRKKIQKRANKFIGKSLYRNGRCCLREIKDISFTPRGGAILGGHAFWEYWIPSDYFLKLVQHGRCYFDGWYFEVKKQRKED